MLVSQLLATVATTALAIIVARTLGPGDFGIFAGFLALSWALVVLVELGVGVWLLRELSQRYTDTATTSSDDAHGSHALLVGAFTLTGSLGSIVLLVALLAAILLGTGTQLTVVLMALLGYTLLLGASGIPEASFRATRNLGIVSAILIWEKLVLLALVAGALWLDLGLTGVAAAYLAAGGMRLAASLGLARLRGRISWVRPSIRAARHIAKSSFPFALNTGLTTAVIRLDPAVVGLLSATAAGFFAVGDRIVGALLVIPTVAGITLFPHLAQSRDVRSEVRRVAGFLGAIGAVAAVVVIAVAPVLVPRVFGGKFSDAAVVVQIMACVLPFMFASTALIAGLYSLGLERRVLPVTAATVISGTVLVAMGQAIFGVRGAASGYLARQVVFTVILLGLLRLTHGSEEPVAAVEPVAVRQP